MTFVIRDDVWRRILPLCITYFQVQSCGREVPGWHEACHLDDGYFKAEDRYIDATGGWHDAGDFRKWASSTALIAISLLIGHRLWKGRERSLGLADNVFLDEAMQGCDYFLNLQQPDGSLLHNIGGGRYSYHDNGDCRYTDNIKESGDERLIHPGIATPPPKYTTLYALYAEELAPVDAEKSARCLEAAKRSMAFDLQTANPDMDHVQWRAWAALILYRITKDPLYQSNAIQYINQMLAMQVTDFMGGQQITRGFWRAHPQESGFHRKHVGNDYPIWVLGEFLDAFPDHPDTVRWRDAITLWVDDYVRVFADRNPFGLLPYSFYDAPPAAHPEYTYRQIGDQLYFRYFLANEGRISNARCSLSAVALAAAAKALNRPALMDDAYRLLEWTLGANPFQMSTMSGVGVNQADALSFQMGNIPGGVMLGPGGDEADMPFYKNPRSCSDEYYGYQTSQFMWAVLALEHLQ